MSFLDRLIEYMKSNNLRQTDLVVMCNSNKSFISGILNGKRNPNIEFLSELSKASKKSINWWLFGKDEYIGLQSLNTLIDTYIKDGDIKEDGSYNENISLMLDQVLKAEIRVKLRNIKEQKEKARD